MPTIARAVATGYPHHIVQRGNNREKIFFDKEDRERYLSLLKKYAARWDSKAHIIGARDEVLGEELFPTGQRKDYIGFIRTGITEKEMNNIRYYTKTGRPFGSEEFTKKMEKKLERRFILKPPGRPKKKETKLKYGMCP